MIYRKEFFDLQWRFAAHAAALAEIQLAEALFEYTNFYARFGLGRDFDAANPTWRQYVEGLQRSATPRDWTYDFYRSRLPDTGAPGVVASFGCFCYARHTKGRIRLHFQNADGAGASPLAAHRQEQRHVELAELFEHVRRHEAATVKVTGASWLYNIEAYRRLFPREYLASAVPSPPRFRGMPLWGQFLDRQGAIRQEAADSFMRQVSAQEDVLALGACFPYQVLALEAAASAFACPT